jgi:hypothetical protein
MTSSIDSIMAEKKYKPFKTYEKLSKTGDNMIRRIDRANREAYQEFESLVLSEDGKEVDLDKYKDDEDLQEQGVQKMKKVHLKYAKEALNASPTNKFEEELLLNAVGLATETELRRIVTTYKHKLTFDTFKNLYEKQMKPRVAAVLRGAAGGHLTDKHVDDLLDYALHPDAVKHLKGYVTLDQAKSLLDYFIEHKEKLGIRDVIEHHEKYSAQTREPLLPSPLVSKLEKALEEKRKKEEEKELPEAA